LKVLFEKNMKNGLKTYWFLISKGIKTYMYLPTYFKKFCPKADYTENEMEKKIKDILGVNEDQFGKICMIAQGAFAKFLFKNELIKSFISCGIMFATTEITPFAPIDSIGKIK